MSNAYPPPDQHQPSWGAPQPPEKKNTNWKVVGPIAGGVVIIALIGALSDKDGSDAKPSGLAASSSAPGEQTVTATASATVAETTAKAEASTRAPAEKAALPLLVGKGLQAAQDTAQAAGFYVLSSHDSLGRGRLQAFDRNWKVCFQQPDAGQQSTDAEVDLGAVKLEEDCPLKDGSEPADAGAKMPDFAGKSVKVARESLDSSTSITVEDASGDSRFILMESNWQVCTQDPAPGKALDGQPVTFTAVKFDESCS